jgi:hypothetical protein
MRHSWRWWLAGLLTLLAFLIVTWVVTRYLTASWLKDAGQRLLVGSGAGVAVAGLVALWGKTFAVANAAPAEPRSSAVPMPGARAVIVGGSNSGIASAGDHVRNIQNVGPLRGVPTQASGSSGHAAGGEDALDAWVRIEGNNEGIASAGNDTTNIQEGL